MKRLPADALAAALVKTVEVYQLASLDVASLRASLLSLDPDARGALVLERLQTYANGMEFTWWRILPAVSFVLDVTDDAEVMKLAYSMVHNRLTARRRSARGVSLTGEDLVYFTAAIKAGGVERSAFMVALLTWHNDDASIVAAVLDALSQFADPLAVGAMQWVTRFDKANRARAVRLLVKIGEDALDTIESLAMSDEAAAREVAFTALATMKKSALAKAVAGRVKTRVKGVSKEIKATIVAMAEDAPPVTAAAPPAVVEPATMVTKRRRPKLPPRPDTSEAEAALAVLRTEADGVSEASRVAFFAALERGDDAAIDAAVDAIDAPAITLASRWLKETRSEDFASLAVRVLRVMARVSVSQGTATEVVLALTEHFHFDGHDVVPVLERFAPYVLGPASLVFAKLHFWNGPALIAVLARHHAREGYRLFLDAIGDFRSRDDAMTALDVQGDGAIEGVAAQLHSKDGYTSMAAAQYFTRIANPAAQDAIEYALPRVKEGVHNELRRALAATLKAARGG